MPSDHRRAFDGCPDFYRLFLYAALVGGVLALGIKPAAAQSATETLSGVVLDQDGAAITGASVVAFNVETGLERRAQTDDAGQFVIPLLPVGLYTVTFRREGFKTVSVSGVTLGVGYEPALRVRLGVGHLSEYVTVRADGSGEVSSADESPAAAVTFGRDAIENLPLNGGSFQSLLSVVPGAVLTKTNFGEQGQFSFNGQRPNANYFTVDGVSANFGVSAGAAPGQSAGGSLPALSSFGGTNNLVQAEATREVKVEAGTYAAEFGRTPGAQIAFTTRAGTNELRGSAFYNLRNEALDAADWFANARRLPKPPSRLNHFGVALGGPLVRNRTFFFLAYEGARLLQPRVASTRVPSETTRRLAPPQLRPLLDAFPRPTPGAREFNDGTSLFAASYGEPSTLDAFSLRLDQTVSERLTLFGRYAQSPSTTAQRGSPLPPVSTARVTSGLSASAPLRQSLSTVGESHFETRTLTVGADFARGSRLAGEARLNLSRARGSTHYRLDGFGGAAPPPDSYFFTPAAAPGDRLIQIVVARSSLEGANLRVGKEADNTNRQLNLVGTVGVVSRAHMFKVGLDYRRLTPVYDAPAYTQTATFTGFGISPGDFGSVVSGSVVGSLIYTEDAPRRPLFQNLSLFAQDTWHARPRLTLSYGLRWELNPPPRERTGRHPAVLSDIELGSVVLAFDAPRFAPAGTPLWATTYGNFAPRVAAAYLVSPKTGLTLRGGFGLYFDLGNGQAAQAFGSVYPFARGRRGGISPFPLAADAAAPPPLDPGLADGTFYSFDPQLKLPYTRQWSLTAEGRLGAEHTFSVSYLGAQGRRLLRGEVFLRPFAPPGLIGRSTIVLTRNAAASDYHALQAQFTRRLSRGLQAFASYTLSHSIDDASDASSTRQAAPGTGARGERGPSDFDVRHALGVAASYDLPTLLPGRFGAAVARNWSAGVIFRARTATPFDLTLSSTIEGGGLLRFQRPDVVAGVPLFVRDPRAPGGRYLNPEAFAEPAEMEGSLGRNALRGFGLTQVDVTLRRRFTLAGRLSAQLRAEVYNLLNHPNFANPGPGLVATQTLAQSLGTGGFLGGMIPLYQVGGPRSIQLGLRLDF